MAATEISAEPGKGVSSAKDAGLVRHLRTAGRTDSQLMLAWRRFVRHRLAVVGLILIFILAVLTLAAPLISVHDPIYTDLAAISKPPDGNHVLGTDRIGRDVWARLLYGGRVSLSVGLVSVSLAVVIGTTLGCLAGYLGGAVDAIIMRFTDIIICFPSLIIILTVVALIGPSIYNTMLVLGLLSWTGICRLVRGQILSLRAQDFVLAARCTGVPTARTIVRHILPNTVAPIIVAATLGIASAILTEAGLSFLGLGVPLPHPSWGNMLNQAQTLDVLERAPWMWIPPGLMISLSVLAINFVGDALRDALDPRMTIK